MDAVTFLGTIIGILWVLGGVFVARTVEVLDQKPLPRRMYTITFIIWPFAVFASVMRGGPLQGKQKHL